jgi:hypothetical protein
MLGRITNISQLSQEENFLEDAKRQLKEFMDEPEVVHIQDDSRSLSEYE